MEHATRKTSVKLLAEKLKVKQKQKQYSVKWKFFAFVFSGMSLLLWLTKVTS